MFYIVLSYLYDLGDEQKGKGMVYQRRACQADNGSVLLVSFVTT
jgi:hypothetical protein